MRETIPNIIPPTIRPSLEVVRNQFEAWRKRRRRRGRIPETLWQVARELCGDQGHSVWEVCRVLRLNYNDLKNRVQESRDRSPAVRQDPDLGFVRLDLGGPLVSSECLVEMETPNGAKMRMSIRGVLRDVDPVELSCAFWRQGR
jgi:hypothetical protein